MVIALGVFLSILFPAAIAQSAHAALLNDLSNVATSLTTQVNAVTQSVAPVSTPQSSNQPSRKQTTNTQTQATPSSVSTPATTAAVSQRQAPPATVTSARPPMSMTIEARETLDMNNLRLMALMTPLALNVSRPAIVMSGSSSMNSAIPLRSSAQGWELFGVAWYWWTIAAAIGSSGLYSLRRFMAPRNLI